MLSFREHDIRRIQHRKGTTEPMELDVSVNDQSLSIPIEDPYRLDIDAAAGRIEALLASQGVTKDGLDVRGLLPKMIRGVVGCEQGCPANAKDLVEQGYQNFSLVYIEGGILTATAAAADGHTLILKLFPEF